MSVLSKKQWFQAALGGLILILFLLGHPINHQPAQAQLDTSTSFRLSRIETNIRTLQSDIRQLETALNRIQRSPSDTSSTTIIVQDITPDQEARENVRSHVPFPYAPEPSDIETAQGELMFDQLATLVIETRQDVFELQEKVADLEQKP